MNGQFPIEKFDFSGYANFIPNMVQGYKAAALPQQMKEAAEEQKLRKSLLETQNKYAEPMAQAGVSQAQSQTDLFNAQAASAKQKSALHNTLMRIINGEPSAGIQEDLSSIGGGQQVRPPMAIQQSQPQQGWQQRGNPSAGQGQEQPNKIDAAWLQYPQLRGEMKEMGITGKQQIINNPDTGEIMQVTSLPSGQVQVESQKVGMDPFEKAKTTESGKLSARDFQTTVDAYQNSSAALDTLNVMKSEILENPDFKNVIGLKGANELASYWFGSPQQKELLGKVNAYTGDILFKAMQSLKGTGTISNSDMMVLKNSVPNEKDTPEQFAGKVNALSTLTERAVQRAQLKAELMDGGMSSFKATQEAKKQISLQDVSKDVSKKFSGKGDTVLMVDKKGNQYQIPKDMAKEAEKELTYG